MPASALKDEAEFLQRVRNRFDLDDFGIQVRDLRQEAAAAVADSYDLGSLFAGMSFFLIVAALMFFISAWGSGVATGAIEFICYRVLGGLAVGAASVLAPAYISEVAPAGRAAQASCNDSESLSCSRTSTV